MISMDGKDWDGDIHVEVLVIDMIKSTLKGFARITEHLQLAGFVAEAVHSNRAHHLVHGFARWLVLMKEISGKQNHINISFLGQAHDLVEALPAVISTNGIPLIVPDVVVG